MQLSPGLKESGGVLLSFCVRWATVFMLITCVKARADRVMMFRLMLDDTGWINNEPCQKWTTWLFISSKISMNFTAMSWQPSAKGKWSAEAKAGPNQFQLGSNMRCYHVFYCISHSYIRSNCINTRFIYDNTNIYCLGLCVCVFWGVFGDHCKDVSLLNARSQAACAETDVHESQDGANCL